MEYLISIFTGFGAAFLGLLAPSMLNMTVAKTSIERGKIAGIQFALGAATFVIVQASVALFFSKYLTSNPQVIFKLKTIAIFVLFGLAVFFFLQARRENKIKVKTKKGHPYIIGLGMSSLNMLGIPFYLTMAIFAENEGLLTIKMPFSLLFVFGAFLGDFTLFSLYAIFAIKISEKAAFITKNINYILSSVLFILALVTSYQVLIPVF